MSLQKHITAKQISRLPLRYYTGPVEIIRDLAAAHHAVKFLINEKVVGFDIESRPAFTKGISYPPSLIQLAGETTVFIFQLSRLGGLTALKPILENDKILKVGVAVDLDIKNLFKIEQFTPKNFRDLATFSKRLNVSHSGLRNLAAIFLRSRISKRSRLTDWSHEQLSPQQISYAATDAWVSREIFFRMLRYFD